MQEKNNCLKVYPNATGVNLYNGLLYFNSGGITSDIPAKIGTFNIQKQEYEWVYQINSKKPFPSYTPPIYHSGRLYILDGENVLHVFEEEKKSNEFL